MGRSRLPVHMNLDRFAVTARPRRLSEGDPAISAALAAQHDPDLVRGHPHLGVLISGIGNELVERVFEVLEMLKSWSGRSFINSTIY